MSETLKHTPLPLEAAQRLAKTFWKGLDTLQPMDGLLDVVVEYAGDEKKVCQLFREMVDVIDPENAPETAARLAEVEAELEAVVDEVSHIAMHPSMPSCTPNAVGGMVSTEPSPSQIVCSVIRALKTELSAALADNVRLREAKAKIVKDREEIFTERNRFAEESSALKVERDNLSAEASSLQIEFDRVEDELIQENDYAKERRRVAEKNITALKEMKIERDALLASNAELVRVMKHGRDNQSYWNNGPFMENVNKAIKNAERQSNEEDE